MKAPSERVAKDIRRQMPRHFSAEEIIRRTRQLAAVRAERTDNPKATRNLLMLVESGAMEATDPDVKARLADHKTRRLHLDKQIADMEKLTDE